MRSVLVLLFVFISSVLCIHEKDNYGVQARYTFNHPPTAEENDPIPVAVVYVNDGNSGKTLKSEAKKDSKPDINTESESHDTKEPLPSINVETSIATKKIDLPVRPKARALSELQIPVAVVYDSKPDTFQNAQQTKSTETNKPRRRYKQLRRRKQENKTTEITMENANPAIQNIEIVKPPISKIESVKPQTQRIEVVRRNPSSIETNTKGVKTKRERDAVVPIVESENYVFSHTGNFHYSYESGDGTKAHSEGQLRSANDDAAGEAVSGGFSYTDNEGNDFSLSYTAGENGYRPIGAHLPTPPPIPPAIARALAYLATATTPEPVTKPSIKRN